MKMTRIDKTTLKGSIKKRHLVDLLQSYGITWRQYIVCSKVDRPDDGKEERTQ